ncbi:sensor histidine kinase [Geobacter sp. SVR]|uniref:sensor histidine kinase n=1 Tax=Geobacter sp. SVR TaxID=2495594 RepID=UPI00143EFA2E|nr:PAS domain-containing sensor histidine kinase [Geobacter sp. SVR]BCS54935.1 hypothetical protein GSVR_32430 [Geobacter sp. SVR]GCF86134.1 hypothetical protein GSbR_27340 [Geobacter sp. SVR]
MTTHPFSDLPSHFQYILKHRPFRYAIAALLVGAAYMTRLNYFYWFGHRAPFVTFYPAVLLAAWYGGLLPGILATVLSAAIAIYYVIPPVHSLWLHDQVDIVLLTVFIVFCGLVSGSMELMKRYRQRVDERTAELARAVDSLREESAERALALEELREKDRLIIQQSRLAAMGEMISYIAHQWRQPLNNLGLLVQQLKVYNDMSNLHELDIGENVAKAMQVIQHMSRTIRDFSDFFKPEKSRTDFNVSEAIRKTVGLLEAGLASQNVTIHIRENGQMPYCNGYENEYAQVILVILQNAKDICAERRIKDPTITISIAAVNGRSAVTISDNAGGIPAAIIDHVFEPYFTTKGPAHGTGLGLFMAKTIIEKNMGGSLTVHNVEGGAEFRIEV